MQRFASTILFVLCLLCVATPAWGDLRDRFWGGRNQETSFSLSFIPGHHPQMNLGAPQPHIPVQATHGTRAIDIPQAHLPMITIPAGAVGSIGQPATFSGQVYQAPPGAEIIYVLPTSEPTNTVINIDGQQTVPAMGARVVSAQTPGAIPVALHTVVMQRPRVEYRWTYGPVVNRTETLVHVVDPRTNRVVRTLTHEEEERTRLPWLHRREIVTYETVETQIAVPVSLAPSTSSAVNTFIHGGLP